MFLNTEEQRRLDFLYESNKIEGILEGINEKQIEAFDKFLELKVITIYDLLILISVFQPNAKLRDQVGLNVRVGNYFPPKGGYNIRTELEFILDNPNKYSAWEQHIEFEKLHPFTDCNGRIGRMLWAWHFRDLSLGFLRMFYYQTLQNTDIKK